MLSGLAALLEYGEIHWIPINPPILSNLISKNTVKHPSTTINGFQYIDATVCMYLCTYVM